MIICLIRHGKTRGNTQGRYIGGELDEELCGEGVRECLESAYRYEALNPDLVFSSPMKRCTQTAGIFFPGREQIIVDEFHETLFGEFSGKNYKELNGNPDYQAFIDSGGMIAFPKGESVEEVVGRVSKGFAEMIRRAEEADAERIAAVVHGGTIMAVCYRLFGGDYHSYMVKNGECIYIKDKDNFNEQQAKAAASLTEHKRDGNYRKC